MINKALLIACLCLLMSFGNVILADECLPDDAQILATNFEFQQYKPPIISPDGTRLAFVHQEELYLYKFGDAAAHVIENAHSFYALIKDPAVDLVELGFDAAAAGRRESAFSEENATAVFKSMSGLGWTADSQGIVSSISHPPRPTSTTPATHTGRSSSPPSQQLTYCVRPIDGRLQALATLDQPIRYDGTWQITRDARYLILNRGLRPLIWNVESACPVATPYYQLSASPTSDRWIGVEKDSLRFVILDKNWNVLERTKFAAPFNRFVTGRHLQWSDDERFVLYRHQIGFDHYEKWIGIWLDLQSGNKQELEGLSFGADEIAFTGQDGTWAIKAYIGRDNEHITRFHPLGWYCEVRKPRARSIEVAWRWEEPWEPNRNGPQFFVSNREFTRFVLAEPDPSTERMLQLSLMNRNKLTTRLAGLDASKMHRIIGFANGDREVVIVANGRLISLPLPTGGKESQSQ